MHARLKWYFVSVLTLLSQLNSASQMPVLLYTYNMMLIKENTGTSLQKYWNSPDPKNDPTGDKHTRPIYTLIPLGNFRSRLIDEWDINPPQEVAILFFNNIGDLQFWMFFNTRNASANVTSWITPKRLIGSMSYGMRQDITESIWGFTTYQFVLKKLGKDKAWFAISNRNVNDGEKKFPYFIVPRSFSSPFDIIPENKTVNKSEMGLLMKSGPHESKQSVEVQIGTTFSVFVTGIEVTITASDTATQNIKYKLQYSQQDCGTSERTDYRDSNAMVLELSAGILQTIEQLYAKCMWITFQKPVAEFSVNVYAPIDDDFVTLPVVVFRGFWYGEKSHDKFTTPAESLKQTTEVSSSQEKSSPMQNSHISTATTGETDHSGATDGKAYYSAQTTTISKHQTSPTVHEPNSTYPKCTCTSAHIINISQLELQKRILVLQEKLRVNKSSLSSQKKKLISIRDDRLSAKSIGCVAGSFLFLVVLAVMILDLSTLHKDICHSKISVK